MDITPSQCRMARAAIGLTRAKLSELANISSATLADFEAGKRVPYERTLRDIKSSLCNLGVTFLAADENGPGVRVYERR